MKKVIRLSESDLISIVNKVIHEQQDLGLKGKTLSPKYAPPKYGENTPEWHHTMNMLLGIGSSFFGPIGMITAAGIGLADAKQYYDEGDTKTAGMVAMFSFLPGAGQIPKLFPAIRQLGAKGMAALAPKLFPGGGSLSKVESEVVQEISENLPLIQQELNAHVMNLAAQGAKTVTNPTKAQALKNLAKQGVKGLTKAVAPFVAAGGAYGQGYDAAQKNTPKSKVESEGLEWEFVRTTFGSSGSQQDNVLLTKAWDKGWRPGIIVPKEFRTQKYQNELDQEEKNLEQLDGLIAQASGSQQQK